MKQPTGRIQYADISLRSVVVSLLVLSVLFVTAVQHPSAAATGLSPCSVARVTERVGTNQSSYGPGATVSMTLSATNTSTSACALGVGPTSPSFVVTNQSGVEVWDNCYANDQPGACAMYLMMRDLGPGATFSKTVSWDQGSGQSRARVALGMYHVTANFIGSRSVGFRIGATNSARTITLFLADSGRSYRLRVGDIVLIRLTGAALYRWTAPVPATSLVLVRTSATASAIATARFVARSIGRVRVTATANPTCYPECLMPSRIFEVTVTVTG